MQPDEYPKFLEVLTGVHDFYGKDMSDFAASLWIEAMKAFELQQVTKALTGHLMDADRGQFMPKPADIVRQLQGTQTDRALVAWGKVSAAIGQVGAYSDVVFDDPLIHLCVVDAGGWPKVCRTTYEEQSYLQHRFCEAYRAYARRGECGEYPGRLTGAGSGRDDFAKRGMLPPPPVLVGDKDLARLVLSGGTVARLAATVAVLTLPDLRPASNDPQQPGRAA
ncbi:hypothetical protein SAMN05216359_105298 [Roseateles sp. YR242]|uniref:DUF6475 domain-containing protein n=1 Tax=Roseateles sp. YR242 TaxID=1855305 RepID=UPI0008B8DE6C|nr:DUF6475 domain-containing protein [Roseateles sp. YR242]SEL12842.1 hypothetical protein SAMN05216359_105298 [Roseateles sp. YR242]